MKQPTQVSHSDERLTQEVIEIQAYNFPEFCEKVQEAIVDGYRFDMVNNDNYPSSFGSFYFVKLFRDVKRMILSPLPDMVAQGAASSAPQEVTEVTEEKPVKVRKSKQ